MPVVLRQRRGKHRIIDLKTGLPAVDEKGQPVDGGGKRGPYAGGHLKKTAIEMNEAESE